LSKYAVVCIDGSNKMMEDGQIVTVPFLTTRKGAAKEKENKRWMVNAGFPQEMEVKLDMNHLDEGSAALLHGLVLASQPTTVLETGTHKGRSTKAIASALVAANHGHLYTIDIENFGVPDSGALSDLEMQRTTFCVGSSPDMLGQLPIEEPIDFAYLDAGHHEPQLLGELEFVAEHAADRVIVVCDNTEDDMWPGVRSAIDTFVATRYEAERVTIPTMCGFDVITLERGHGEQGTSEEGEEGEEGSKEDAVGFGSGPPDTGQGE
tara:strand:+ start:46478 stop:47269 length:792 start_codon:yes stop_codon:yes gene_type:complete